MVAILNFRSEYFKLFLIYKSPRCFLPSFKSIALSVHEKKRKIYFQDCRHSGHLGFLMGTILSIFDLQVIEMLPNWFRFNLLLVQAKWKLDFQDGRIGSHLGFRIESILGVFALQVTRCFLPSFKSTDLSVQEKKRKTDFQDGHHGGNLGFSIRTFLSIFGLQVTPMLPTELVNWLLVQEKKWKIDFQGGHLGFPITTILAILICKSPWSFLPSFETIGPGM